MTQFVECEVNVEAMELVVPMPLDYEELGV